MSGNWIAEARGRIELKLEAARQQGGLGNGADVDDSDVGVVFLCGVLEERKHAVGEDEGADIAVYVSGWPIVVDGEPELTW